MILTQRYNSVNEIDAGLIPSIERLLSDCIPNFSVLKNYEANTSEDTKFSYFLFFGNQSNAPIGFAQVEIIKGAKIKHSFFKRFGKKEDIDQQYEKSITWKIPGSLNEGIIFEPTYIKHAHQTAETIFQDFFEREDVINQTLVSSTAYMDKNIFVANQADKLEPKKKLKHNHKLVTIADTLVKGEESYQVFFESLPKKIASSIKSDWKKLQIELQFKMGTYHSFKECFEYKKEGPSQYKKLKKHPKVVEFLKDESKLVYLTFETSAEIKAFIIYAIGSSGNAFYDVILDDDVLAYQDIPKSLLHQIAIIQFYECDVSQRLHLLNPELANIENTSSSQLLDLGFTKREQFSLSMAKLQ